MSSAPEFSYLELLPRDVIKLVDFIVDHNEYPLLYRSYEEYLKIGHTGTIAFTIMFHRFDRELLLSSERLLSSELRVADTSRETIFFILAFFCFVLIGAAAGLAVYYISRG